MMVRADAEGLLGLVFSQLPTEHHMVAGYRSYAQGLASHSFLPFSSNSYSSVSRKYMRCLAILYKEQEGKRVGEEEKGHQRHRGREHKSRVGVGVEDGR